MRDLTILAVVTAMSGAVLLLTVVRVRAAAPLAATYCVMPELPPPPAH